MSLLGDFTHHVLDLDLTSDSATTLDRASRIGGEDRSEFAGVFAFFGEPTKPFPGEGNRLGNQIAFLDPALHVSEVDVGVPFNSLADFQEVDLKVGERNGWFFSIATISSERTVRGQDGPSSLKGGPPWHRAGQCGRLIVKGPTALQLILPCLWG